MGRSWARLGGENSRSKGFWGRRQANGCFQRCRGEGFCAGGMVARQTVPGCTRCVRTEKGSARTKRARAEAPRTGVYVISAWNVGRTGRTGCNRAQGSFFADGTLAEFYSMADSSTTAAGIPILIAGGCWARRQLHAGIRYVLVASKLRISLASVKRRHR